MRALRYLLVAGLSAFTAVTVAACGSPSGPPQVNYGRDTCDECHMIISEAKFAAAYRAPNGREYKFDDIGDMVAFGVERRDLDDAKTKAWVHDYDTEKWLDAKKAVYVAKSGVSTPMGRGVIAFATRAKADAFAEKAGAEVRTWKELLADPPDAEEVLAPDESASTTTTTAPPASTTPTSPTTAPAAETTTTMGHSSHSG